MANLEIIVTDGNNLTVDVTPQPATNIVIDRGVAGNGIESITLVDVGGETYLEIVYTNGTSEQLGPLESGVYFGVAPITITGNDISLADTAVTIGEYGSASQTVTYTVDSKGRLTASQEQSIAITLSQVTDAGTIASQNANNVSITGGSISGTTVSGYVPTTTTITAGTGLSGGGDLSANRTIDLANTAVVAATYGSASQVPVMAVNAQGQSTSVTNTTISIAQSNISDAGIANGVATLDAGGTVPLSQIPASIQGGVSYQGTWNASTNTPTLVNGVGTKGYYYVVSVAGSTNLDGITTWNVGDWAIFNGTVWQKVDNTDAVTSVNGYTGTVVLTTTDVAEGTNEYFTTARARVSVSAGTAISYDNSTGVITNSAPDLTVALTGGTGISTSGTYPNFTITNTSPSSGGDVAGPSSATDNAVSRFDGTTGKLIQNSVVTISDTGAIAGVLSVTDPNFIDFNTGYTTPVTQGQLGWDGTFNSLALGMIGGNVIQHIGEDTYIYVKASSAITKGQVVMFTGSVGASGVATAAPATGVTNGQTIIGVAAENIANNGFGLIQTYGELRSVNTSAFADGDILYYNSAVTGGFTTTYPTSGVIVTVAAVLNGGSAGGGVITIRVSVTQRITASTGISVSQTSAGSSIGNTGVTSVTGTSPIVSSGGATPAISLANTAVVAGSYTNTNLTVDAQGRITLASNGSAGGVTTFSAGTTGLTPNTASTGAIVLAGTLAIANGGTGQTTATTAFNALAPSQTSNSGKYLTTDGTNSSWATVAAGAAISNDTSTATNLYPMFAAATSGTPTTLYTSNAKYLYKPSTGELQASAMVSTNGINVNNATVSTSYTIASGNNGLSVGPVTVASGQSVTVSTGQRWVIL